MINDPRLQSLLSRIPDHPLAPAIKASVIDAHAAAEAFAAKKAELSRAGTLTPKGQHQELRNALVHQYGKDLARARDPIRKARREIQTRREALKVKAVDPTNLAAALERQETRQWLRSLDLAARRAVALTTKDKRILEAAVVAPPELSGFDGPLSNIIDQVEARYLELEHPDEIAALSAMETVIAEGNAGIDVAAVLIKGTSDLDDRQFDLIMKPLISKVGAPWIRKFTEDGREVIRVIEPGSNTAAVATPAQIADGVYYENHAAYLAARGIADPAAHGLAA
jgi:hypothetical protein